MIGLSHRSSIHFKDHINDFSDDPASTNNQRVISLPNPHRIAIHSAIAEILHTSGAGRFFDELLKEYRSRDERYAVRSWSELETLMEKDLLRESVISMFQSVHGI